MISTVAIALAWTAAVLPPGATPALLVGFDELEGKLKDPGLRLLDARPRAEYERGHIPGAVWVDAAAIEKESIRPGVLSDRNFWESWIKPLGIEPGMTVLAYDSKRQLDAARLWWLLRYLGVEKAGLIDGGYSLWAEQGRPISREVTKVGPRAHPIRFQSGRLATREDVLDDIKVGKSRIVDARTGAEHVGTDLRSKRGGRIPSACHLEWVNLVDAKGRFLSESALRSKLEKSGVKPDRPVITHCQGGGRASVDAFVFERLGFPTRNYYLGWSDWGNADETPVESSQNEQK